jgi:hypothetical protein
MDQRTLKQNSSLHLFFGLLADELNAAGLDMRTVLKPSVDIPWTSETVKNQLFKPIQKALLEKESTTELTTIEVNKVYEVLMRHLSEKFGVFVEFPSIEDLKK